MNTNENKNEKVVTTQSKCWLCLRITPKQIAKAVHILPFPKKLKHQIISEAVTYVEKAYRKNPTFFCSKSAIRIIGGLLYILSIKYQWSDMKAYRLTQEEIAQLLQYLSKRPHSSNFGSTIRKGCYDWKELFPNILNGMTTEAQFWRNYYTKNED